MLRDMFKKTYTRIDTRYRAPEAERTEKQEEEPGIPAGMWRKCNKCGKPIYVEDVRENFYVCPKCGGYFRVHAWRRIQMVTDPGTFEEWDREMEVSNPLNFPGYEKKLEAAREKSRLNEAIVTGCGKIGGNLAVIGVCDARFLMSSMGHNVGEKITRAVERATREKLPVVLFACSGGARMQEGIVSLMQMAKTAAALKHHHDAGQLFVSVLTDPTTGGVTASFAMLGDIILAEPGALIGFAGPRVIEQTIGQKLPEGFQRAEFLLDHGFVDKIVERKELKQTLETILRLHRKEKGTAGGDSVQRSHVYCDHHAGDCCGRFGPGGDIFDFPDAGYPVAGRSRVHGEYGRRRFVRKDHVQGDPRQGESSHWGGRRVGGAHGGPRRAESRQPGGPHQFPAHARHGAQCGGRYRLRHRRRRIPEVLWLRRINKEDNRIWLKIQINL